MEHDKPMSDIKLGQEPSEDAQRDAIHIAIIPMIAGQNLQPGDSVEVSLGLAFKTNIDNTDKAVGIVDPFISYGLNKGERFWLLLKQNTITGMRHHWSHPAFKDELPVGAIPTVISESEQWLRDFARQHFYDDYDDMMKQAKDGYLCFGDDNYPQNEEEFFAHVSNVIGSKKEGYFRCAC